MPAFVVTVDVEKRGDGYHPKIAYGDEGEIPTIEIAALSFESPSEAFDEALDWARQIIAWHKSSRKS